MIIMATGHLTVEAEEGRLRMSVPSGRDTLEISLSLHQALALMAATERACAAAYDGGFADPLHHAAIIVPRCFNEWRV
ncbi:hypothetical protein [Sphingobium ummariense]